MMKPVSRETGMVLDGYRNPISFLFQLLLAIRHAPTRTTRISMSNVRAQSEVYSFRVWA